MKNLETHPPIPPACAARQRTAVLISVIFASRVFRYRKDLSRALLVSCAVQSECCMAEEDFINNARAISLSLSCLQPRRGR